MKAIRASATREVYDEATDVMYFGIGSSRFTDEEEVAPGIHVLYAYDGGRTDEVVGVEVECFNERFAGREVLSIPANTPFTIELDQALVPV